jgi:hypothetical protein
MKTGMKSINSNPKKFEISYITKANIDPNKVMHLCCDVLIERLNKFLNIINIYCKNIGENNYGDSSSY